ncbi:Zn-ribbon domain-containing OB-fold protein [Variovorax sp. KK3]|uniref:Zn-ribbon domain-containing OB-fold protein n=1 Tax=Variovorax sp. KK3 TaxID=1855728 RepID=UPI00097C5074|nr:OB-fold domain-containing protein [Variovorax sp. KK3]
MSQTHSHDGWPQPYRLPDAEPYWQALERQQLKYQRCSHCQLAVWPAHSYCPHCDSPALAWQVSTGRGTVYSFSTVMRGPTPVWQAIAPYTVGFVQMEEGHFLFAQIEGRAEAIRIDSPVHARFVRRGAQTLPVFTIEH